MFFRSIVYKWTKFKVLFICIFSEHSFGLHGNPQGSQPPTPTSPYMYPGLSPLPGLGSPVFGTAFSFSPTHSDMSTPPSTPPHNYKAKKGVFTYGMFVHFNWCCGVMLKYFKYTNT